METLICFPRGPLLDGDTDTDSIVFLILPRSNETAVNLLDVVLVLVGDGVRGSRQSAQGEGSDRPLSEIPGDVGCGSTGRLT